ncbi:MAG: hypothetical protein ACQXXG_10050 [Candidatus Bathyarchaeia archaeon]
MTEKIVVKCPFCGYVWKPRVDKPVECPRCKNRLDRGKRRLPKCFRNM